MGTLFLTILVTGLCVFSSFAAEVRNRCHSGDQDYSLAVPDNCFGVDTPFCNRCYVSAETLCCSFLDEDVKLDDQEKQRITVFGGSNVNLEFNCVPDMQLAFESVASVSLKPKIRRTSPERCRYNLNLYDTRISLVSDPSTLNVVDSKVDFFNTLSYFKKMRVLSSTINRVIKVTGGGFHLHDESLFIVEDSTINLMESSTFHVDSYLSNSVIKEIQRTTFQNLNVYSTTFDLIHSGGLYLDRGTTVFENVVFGELKKGAIVIGGNAVVHFIDVTVTKCEEPCIETTANNARVISLVIEGKVIQNVEDTSYVKNSEYVGRKVFYSSDESICQTQTHSTRLCSFTTNLDPGVFYPDGQLSKTTKIENVTGTAIMTPDRCGRTIEISHLRNGLVTDRSETDLSCFGESTLILADSILMFIDSTVVSALDMHETTVHSIFLPSLSSLKVENSDISIINEIRVESTKQTDSENYLKNVRVKNIYSFWTTTPMLFEKVDVSEWVRSIRISLIKTDSVVTFQSTNFKTVGKEGIHLERGVLVIKDSKLNLRRGAIVLGQFAKLVFRKTSLQLLDGEFSKCIEVHNMNQIDFDEEIASIIKKTVVMTAPARVPARLAHYTPIKKKDCQEIYDSAENFISLLCDMKKSDDSQYLLGVTNEMSDVSVVEIENLQHLYVGENCFHKFTFKNIEKLEFETKPEHCSAILELYNTKGANLFNDYETLKVENSILTKVSPYTKVKEASFTDGSNVTTMSATFKKLKMDSSSFGNLNLRIEESLTIRNCNITRINKLDILKGATVKIVSSTIKELPIKAINITGRLEMYDVTINKAHNDSIFKGFGSSILFNRVEIKNEALGLFGKNFSKDGDIDLKMANRDAILSQFEVIRYVVDQTQTTMPASPKKVTKPVETPTSTEAITTTEAASTTERAQTEPSSSELQPREPKGSTSTSCEHESDHKGSWILLGMFIMLSVIVILSVLYRRTPWVKVRIDWILQKCHNFAFQVWQRIPYIRTNAAEQLINNMEPADEAGGVILNDMGGGNMGAPLPANPLPANPLPANPLPANPPNPEEL